MGNEWQRWRTRVVLRSTDGLLQPPFSFLLLTRLLIVDVNRVRTEQSALEITDFGMEQATEVIVP